MFATRSASEVFPRDHDVAFLHRRRERGIDILHAVLGELLHVRRVEIARRDYDIGIDIVAILENFAFSLHFTSSGAAIFPAIADAAATAGDAR